MIGEKISNIYGVAFFPSLICITFTCEDLLNGASPISKGKKDYFSGRQVMIMV